MVTELTETAETGREEMTPTVMTETQRTLTETEIPETPAVIQEALVTIGHISFHQRK